MMQKILVLSTLLLITSCSVLTLTPAKFGWSVESVVRVQDNGMLLEDRYKISFNTKALFFEENADSNSYIDKELRLIRNDDGFYFITAPGFKNVYIFGADEGKLKLEEKVLITETGLQKPYLNQRSPYIELVDGERKVYLDNNGIAKEQQ